MTFSEMVREFNTKFDVPVQDTPSIPSRSTVKLRRKLIEEEFIELMNAMADGNLEEIAKEAADLHYVISGMCLAYGIDEDKVFEEVHRSNLSKVWPDGKVRRRDDGKVLKPPTYSPANVRVILGY